MHPGLGEFGPAGDRVRRLAHAKGVAALGIKMHFHRHPCLLQGEVIGKRLANIVRGVVFSLDDEGGWSLRIDSYLMGQLDPGSYPQVPGITCDREVRPEVEFVGIVYRLVANRV